MQELVSTVRAQGANNVILLGGIGFASVLDSWATYEPTDPAGQLAASFHNYDFGGCLTSTCWNNNLTNVGNAPLVTGEMGFDGYIEPYMTWADANGVGYLAWAWDAWGCSGGQALISDYTGTACDPYGTGYQQHLAALALTPTQLVFSTQPGGGTAGQAWTTQPAVTIENVDGNPVTSDSSAVTLTIQNNPGGGTLSSCTASTVAGVATFSGCKIDEAGTGYVLTATDTADGSLTATSNAFTITAGVPAQLVFSVEPGGGVKHTAWAVQPAVTVEDANGNTVTSDANPITLTIAAGTGKKKAHLRGCRATTTAGVAVFSGCRINRVATGFRLTATDSADSISATSAPFDITPLA